MVCSGTRRLSATGRTNDHHANALPQAIGAQVSHPLTAGAFLVVEYRHCLHTRLDAQTRRGQMLGHARARADGWLNQRHAMVKLMFIEEGSHAAILLRSTGFLDTWLFALD
jgi:hypothetical protein